MFATLLLTCISAAIPVMAYEVPDELEISHNDGWDMFYTPDEFGDATDTLIMLNQTEGKCVGASDSDDMFSFLRAAENVKVYTVFMPDGGMGFIIQNENGYDIVPSGSSYTLEYRINEDDDGYLRQNYYISLEYYESPGIFAVDSYSIKKILEPELLSELMAGRNVKCIINFGGNNYSFTVPGKGFKECLVGNDYDHSAYINANYDGRIFYDYDGTTPEGKYIFDSLKNINECSGSLALMINMYFYYYEDLLESGADKDTCRDEAYEKAKDAFLTTVLVQQIVTEQQIDIDVDISELPDIIAGNIYSGWLEEVWKCEQLLPDVYEYLEEHNTVSEEEYEEETVAETEAAAEETVAETAVETEAAMEETVAETEAETETAMEETVAETIAETEVAVEETVAETEAVAETVAETETAVEETVAETVAAEEK